MSRLSKRKDSSPKCHICENVHRNSDQTKTTTSRKEAKSDVLKELKDASFKAYSDVIDGRQLPVNVGIVIHLETATAIFKKFSKEQAKFSKERAKKLQDWIDTVKDVWCQEGYKKVYKVSEFKLQELEELLGVKR